MESVVARLRVTDGWETKLQRIDRLVADAAVRILGATRRRSRPGGSAEASRSIGRAGVREGTRPVHPSAQ
jgi:hypothetical protein